MKRKKKEYVARPDTATLWSYPPVAGEIPLCEQPRPQFARRDFRILNGEWDYAIRPQATAFDGSYDGKITVPFSPEFAASGVGRVLLPDEVLYYRRTLSWEEELPPHLLLHFDAVDYEAEVTLNGVCLGRHTGGYLPFSFDIAPHIRMGENELTVRVTDPTNAGGQMRGKQSLSPATIWYTPQSGIWQTVWLEPLPADYLPSVRITPDVDGECVRFSFPVEGVSVTVIDGNVSTYYSPGGREIVCPMRGARLWSPEDPYLCRVIFRYGEDRVKSYFGMRKFSYVTDRRGHRRLALNGRPYFHNGVLDQGYFPESGLTPPCDRAMVDDLLAVKALGLNTVRKHIKIEPMRFYYHCDRLGLLVWQDIVSGGADYSMAAVSLLPFLGIQRLSDTGAAAYRRFHRENEGEREEFCREAEATVDYLYNVPSLCLYTVFNEGWGQFDSERVTALLQARDASRHYDAVSGWHDQGSESSELRSLHVYFKRFCMPKKEKRCVVLSEFGGYSCPIEGHVFAPKKPFGYRMYKSTEELCAAIRHLYDTEIRPAVRDGLSATVYTQLSDVEEEINGFLTYDRAYNKCKGLDLSIVYGEEDI